MRTELIYSRNRYEDIRLAIDEIQSFRNAYLPVIDPRPDDGQGLFSAFANRLRLLLFPMRFRNLQDSDIALSKMCEQLEELADLVQVSNLMQTTYEKYNGKMDVRVKPSGKSHFTLTVSTSGYSDDIGISGSVRIPAIKREFRLTSEAVDKSFSRGTIDFSWVDGELNSICRNISSIQSAISKPGMPVAYAPTLPALPVFDDTGDKKTDILE